MKWVTIISFIFLVSSTESKHLPRRSRDVGPRHTIGHCYSEIPEEDFKGVALISFIHFVPNITYTDVEKLVEDITKLGKKCAADEHADPECAKTVDILILEELCHEQSVAEHYGFSECCGKVGHEINECLLAHKNATPASFPPYERPDPEVTCKTFQDDRLEVLGHFLYDVSRRNSDTSILILFTAAAKFEEVLVSCCQAEDKAACFKEKAPLVKKEMKLHALMEKQNCLLLKNRERKTMEKLKFAMAAQKFPKADRSILHNITKDIVHIHEERCQGDTLESHLDQITLTKFICEHQDVISPNVSGCCTKPLLERPFCLVTMDHDDPPADLSPTVREFVDNQEVCQHFAENHDGHLERFLYEYARRHPELSPQLLLRTEKGYHDLLEKCCKLESPVECLGEGEVQLRKHIVNTLEVIKTNCELFEHKIEDFKRGLLVRYTKKAPQLSFEELDQYTEQLQAVAAKCCPLGDDKKLVCAEGHADLVLGSICLHHQEHAINPKICQCCSSNYAFRRECFSAIEVDDGYVPAECPSELFSFHEELCTANADVENRKRKLLVKLIKCKPTITEEQLKDIIRNFHGVVAKCCQAENHEQCFQEEGPKLVERSRAALS
uniref:albumin-like n=1 Tax=Euleptes europaea TaxID=460621 RepID=UPI00253FEBDB|nr:albumin-like [Euleptes europaea]